MPLDSHLTLPGRTDRHPRRRQIRVVVALALAAIVVGAGVAFASSSPSNRYRTATVSSRSTDQRLNGVGTIEPISQATVAFPAAGTVATVAVKPGDTVTAGTQLASLDQVSLQEAVNQAQSNVDQAELTLERARNGQSVATGATSGATAQPTSYSSDVGDTADSSTRTILIAAKGGTDQNLAAAQQAVVDAQKQVDQDLAAADQTYATAQQVCSAITNTDGGADSSSQSSSSSTDASNDDVAACTKALNDVLQAQHQVSTSQAALAQALSALDALLAQQTTNAPSGGGNAATNPNTTKSPSQTTGGTSTGGSSANRSSTTPTAADLASYQKAVDSAEANLTVAHQAMLQATIVSPIDGTVVAVNMAAGDTVTAGSTTATILIAGSGGYEAVTMVKVSDLPKLKVGQTASVQPDGSNTTISGTVTHIGLVSTTSTTGTTYPVTIGLSGDTSQLRNGGTATITITTTASAANGLAVPSSAVHANNGTYTVTVVDGDSTKDVTVQVGAIGPQWTEIKGGLNAGQTVVLADLHQELPTSATSSSNGQQQNRFSGRGGFVVPRN
jgi:HlyD family secretion protein